MAYTPPELIPWDKNLIKDFNDTDWQKKWPEMRVKDIDPIEVVADLYLPEGLACHGFVKGFTEPSDEVTGILTGARVLELAKILRLSDDTVAEYMDGSVTEETGPLTTMANIAKEAKEYQAKLVEDVVDTFWAYAHAACGGELRHHQSINGHKLNGVRKGAWVGWRDIFETYGVEALQLMSKLFKEIPGQSIGGKRWAAAADVLYAYETGKLGKTPESNKKIFLDRVLALQHNGGCFLSKRTWANHRAGRNGKIGGYLVANLTPHGQGMVPVLDCHAGNPVNVEGLYHCASPKVQQMTRDYFAAAEQAGLKITANWQGGVESALPAKKAAPKSAPLAQPVMPTLGEVVTGGNFEVQIKITYLKDAEGNEHGSLGGSYTQVPKKSYTFVTTEGFLSKKFYWAHITKMKFPAAKVYAVHYRIVKPQPSGITFKSAYYKLTNEFGTKGMSGAQMYQQLKTVNP